MDPMESNSTTVLERELFGIIPKDNQFPVELSRELGNKLKIESETNWRLKKHIEIQDKEIQTLRKASDETERKTKMNSESCLASQSPQASLIIVDLKHKNRGMVSQIESMKVKMQKLLNENEQYKNTVQELERQVESNKIELNSNEGSSIGGSEPSSFSTFSGDELIKVNQQLSHISHKMMHYRSQCQQLKIERQAALRALSQEVGDNTNAKTVLTVTSSPTWRGRQQQILTLNQKVIDLHRKLAEFERSRESTLLGGAGGDGSSHDFSKPFSVHSDDEVEDGNQDPANYTNEIQYERVNSVRQSLSEQSVFSASQRHLADLQLQDKKKHEQLEKLAQELDDYKAQLKTYQQEKNALKARTITLEGQIRSLRAEIEDYEIKLKTSDNEFQVNLEDLGRLRQELATIKERERKLRETSSVELHEAHQSLNRERAVVIKLQAVLNERQDVVNKMDADIKRLQKNLDLCCNATSSGRKSGSIDIAATIENMKSKYQGVTKVVHEIENERHQHMKLLDQFVGELEAEREKHSQTQLKLVKSFTVIDQTNDCITVCLDECQVTSKKLLSHVETVRALVRELKSTGQLYSLELIPMDDIRKLKTRIGLLCKENGILHHQATQAITERKRDLEQYDFMSTKLRSEFLSMLENASSIFL